MRPGGLAALTFLAVSAAGCASSEHVSTRPLPDWFLARQAELADEGFPDLRNVPDRVDANTDPAHWAQVTASVEAAAAEVRASPRSDPPPSPETQALVVEQFDGEARGAIEHTRRQH